MDMTVADLFLIAAVVALTVLFLKGRSSAVQTVKQVLAEPDTIDSYIKAKYGV